MEGQGITVHVALAPLQGSAIIIAIVAGWLFLGGSGAKVGLAETPMRSRRKGAEHCVTDRARAGASPFPSGKIRRY